MRDRRVGEEPFHVRLSVGRQIAEGAGDCGHQSDEVDREVPHVGQAQGRGPRHLLPTEPSQPEGHAQCHGYGSRLARHGEKSAHLGGRPLKDVRTPEVERHGRELEGQPRGQHQAAEGEDHDRPCRFGRVETVGALAHNAPQFRRHAGEMAGAEHASQQADAVEHHSRCSRPIDGVFQRGLRTRLPPLENAYQRIGRHARHLNGHEQHQQVVGRRHQAHAERCAKHERVEVGTILAIGNPGDLRERNVEHEKPGQQKADEGRERVEDEQAAKQFPRSWHGRRCECGPRRIRQTPEITPRIPERERHAAEGDEAGIEPPQHRQHPAQQHQHDRGCKRQFDAKERQRYVERVGDRAGEK